MKTIYIILICFSTWLECTGQVVNIDDKINLTGDNNAKRKVKNVSDPIFEDDALNNEYYLSGQTQFCIANSLLGISDTLELTIFPAISQLEKGLTLNFISPIVNSNHVLIKINGLPNSFTLNKKAIVPLDSADIANGQMISIVFDGNNFQILSRLNVSCPSNFVKVAEEYCITPHELPPVYFWNAVVSCGDRNARVCSWAEWHHACVNSGILGITNMIGNWEWVDAGGNYMSFTTPPTGYTGLQIGNANCENTISSIIDTTHIDIRAQPKTYRCCYTLK
jgi:hypothetical protein